MDDEKIKQIVNSTGVTNQKAKDLLLANDRDVQRAIQAHKRENESNLVKNILSQAAKTGQEEESHNFGGRGQRLGDQNQGSSSRDETSTVPPVTRLMTFWSEGFSIEDGPLLRYDDPQNKEFLAAIQSGRAPTALLNLEPNQPVEVKIAQRMNEDYKEPPKKPMASFSGTGQRLGSIVPSSASASSSSSEPKAAPVPQVAVDNTQPVTSIQVRLGDGTRMVARFNHTHTVGDLRRFVASARSELRGFVIQTTMPTKILDDDKITLKDANLLNAVIVQRGMAKQMSLGLTGQQIDGIWHTAVVVYGKEYCFGQGIETFTPGFANSLYGSPVETINMGMTDIPREVFLEYMDEMKKIWVKEKYHLLDNNCNHFSDEVCMFLLGKKIPAHITGLPAEFLKTPFGQMMKPMIEQMYGPSARYSDVPPPMALPSKTLGATRLSEIQSLIQKNKCVAVDFTSKTCGPCVQISPYFDELIADSGLKVVGVKVETSEAPEICQHYQISATPTFICFLDGKEFSKTLGANRAELKSAIDFLIYSGYPPHKHANVDYRNIESLVSGSAVGYKLSSNLDSIFKKLYQIIETSIPGFDKSSLETLHSWMKSTDYVHSTILPFDWEVVPMKLLATLPVQSLFPLLDIMRLLLVNESIHNQMINTCSSLIPIYNRVKADSGTPTITMLLKFTCNLYSTREAALESLRDVTTSLVIENLTSSDPKLQQVAALTAYNISWSCNQIVSSAYDSNWVSEIIAALIEALKTEHETETVLRLVGAIGMLLVLSSEDVVEMVNLLGLEEILQGLGKGSDEQSKLILILTKEIDALLKA